jgi:Flp pilus assembly protein, pilin Flp
MKKIFARFAKDESGATAIEYGLIAALMAVAVIAAIALLRPGLEGIFTDISARLDTEGAEIVGE